MCGSFCFDLGFFGSFICSVFIEFSVGSEDSVPQREPCGVVATIFRVVILVVVLASGKRKQVERRPGEVISRVSFVGLKIPDSEPRE